MGFQNLPDIHAARHAERVEHNIDGGAVIEIGHVFNWNDAADDTLVAVPAGHFIARLQFALDRHIYLDHFHNPGRQFVTALQFVDLILEAFFQRRFGIVELLFHGFDFGHGAFVLQGDLPPLAARQFLQHGLGNLGIGVHAFRARSHLLAGQQTFKAVVNIALQNRQFIVAVFCQ